MNIQFHTIPPKPIFGGLLISKTSFHFSLQHDHKPHTHQKRIHSFQGTFSYLEYVLKSVQIHMQPCTAMYLACQGMFKFETGMLNEGYIHL